MKKVIFGIIAALIIFMISSCSNPPGSSSSQLQASYYTINNGSQFIRSFVPFSTSTGSNGIALQTSNPDGSVTLNINNSPAYADCGFYIIFGKLGDLNSVKITVAYGSDPIAINIWFDRNNDGEFFIWSNNVLVGLGGDAYILGPQSTNNFLSVNTGSTFTYLIPGGGDYTLAQLIGSAASGITSTTVIAIWVGITVNSGSSTAIIKSVTIN